MRAQPWLSENDKRLGVLCTTVSHGEARLLSIRQSLMSQTPAIVRLESTHLKQFSHINKPARDEQASIPLPDNGKR